MYQGNKIARYIRNMILKNRQQTVISAILFFLCMSAFIIFIIKFFGHRHFETEASQREEPPLVNDQPLLLPEGSALPEGYIPYQATHSKWSEEDISRWFTTPDIMSIENLGKANDAFMSDVLGATP